jgi:hypothetical protein
MVEAILDLSFALTVSVSMYKLLICLLWYSALAPKASLYICHGENNYVHFVDTKAALKMYHLQVFEMYSLT